MDVHMLGWLPPASLLKLELLEFVSQYFVNTKCLFSYLRPHFIIKQPPIASGAHGTFQYWLLFTFFRISACYNIVIMKATLILHDHHFISKRTHGYDWGHPRGFCGQHLLVST
jgi:hypothetical protein